MNRPCLVLLPGTLNTATLWHAQLEALSPHTDVRVADLTGEHSIAAMAEVALATAPQGRFALAGFSLGGYVALEVMRRAGNRVTALALLNTSARPETPQGRTGREQSMAAAEQDFPRIVDALIQYMLPAERLDDEALVTRIRSMMLQLGAPAFLRQSQAVLERTDSRAGLAAIRCPTVIIAGAQDKVTPARLGEEMAAAIHGAQLHVLPATGHLSPMEQPAQVSDLLRTWLASSGAV